MKSDRVTQVNGYLANLGVLYIKLHNLHWNVVGCQFKAVHEYLEGLYDQVADLLDETAEILKMHEALPLASMKDYLAVATISELESKEIGITETLEIVQADLQILKAQATDIRAKADEEDLFDVVALLEGHVEGYNKTLWFLRAMLQA